VIGLIAIGLLTSGGSNDVTRTASGEGRTLGSAAAPVTIEIWEDFQCPFCKNVNAAALADVEKNYVETGKVKFVYHDYAFLGEESVQAAQAGLCATDQNMFWPYHDALFNHQSGENRGTFSNSNLKAFAAAVGLDTAAFATCLDSQGHRPDVTASLNEGKGLGVTSTPTFFVGSTKIVGAQPYDVFRQAIEAQLAKTPG
jgi:protein-disulfide isomerase